MAETPDTDKLAKRDATPDAPAPDPITSYSTSNILLICALLLTGVLVWSLYDEVSGRRPWKDYTAIGARDGRVRDGDRFQLYRIIKPGMTGTPESRNIVNTKTRFD